MADNKAFHNPKDYGTWDIGTTQVNKVFLFEHDTAKIPEAKVIVRNGSLVLKTYTVGNGITLSNGNLNAELVISGSDFAEYVGKLLYVECNFFVLGDTEIVFKLKPIKTYM